MNDARYADFLGFLAPPGTYPDHIDPEFNLNLIHLTLCPPAPWGPTTCEEIVAQCRKSLNVLKRAQAVSAPDVMRYETVVIRGLQHPPIDANPCKLLEAGIQITTLAYIDENIYGGGFCAPNAPLTLKGKEFLSMLADSGIILDLAHAGHRTARDCLHLIRSRNLRLKVVASHTGSFHVYKHLRNLPDDVLVGIAELGGIVGLYTCTWGLHKNLNSLIPFLVHLEHMVSVCGLTHVCLGTDGTYMKLDEEKEKESFKFLDEALDPTGNKFRARYPEHPPELNSVRKMDILFGTIKEKCSEKSAELICGKNLLDFFHSKQAKKTSCSA